MKKRIAILGATGSIGRQVLSVIGDEYEVAMLSANVNGELLSKEFFGYKTPVTIISNSTYDIAQNDRNKHLFSTSVLADKDTYQGIDVVVNGISGIDGVLPSFAVLESGAKLITANKETFVSAGYLFMARAKELGAMVGERIIPIDSEHSSVWQCLKGENFDNVSYITLTASGGAFRDLSKEEISTKDASFALNHPTWKMGKKVTVDSATLMNKGFEIIEAKHLFNTQNIKVVVHRESIIHSMVTFKDGCSKLQFSAPDMRLPIAYALTEPTRKSMDLGLSTPSLFDLANLKFSTPDYDRFPCLRIATEVALIEDDFSACVMCASDEVAVELYLKNLISFYDISDIISQSLAKFNVGKVSKPDDVLIIYQTVREYILSIIGG
ncbi:MAG: 1-deoxy-D-xylulose-5-phosphate reductoisomerase [Clostridia bacterium]|nr:1-deoxy-D-xylulose-5-phosphate reductoisomerase [Clostridia bacterium]